MKRILLFLVCITFIHTVNAQIIFNEIEADAGNNEGSGGEWIELKNIGTSTVDLSCWKLTNGGSYILNIPSGLQLSAGQYLLIGSASKMMCATCDYPSLMSQFTMNASGFGPGSGSYVNTKLLNVDIPANGGCNCMTGSGALVNGSDIGDRIVLFNASGVIQDAFMYSGGNNYGTDSILVNFSNLGACTPLTGVVVPATNNPIYVGRTVCNDLAACNSSYARIPDGNNVLPITYSTNGNLNCVDCTNPCGLSADIASEDHPTPGLANETTKWNATIDGNAVTSFQTNLTVCGTSPINFEYQIFNYQNVALLANQTSGNLGSFVKVGAANPVSFNSSNYNASTGITTLSATINPIVGSTTYDFIWGNANTICGTCPGANNAISTIDELNVNSECYTRRRVNVFREDALGGTPSVTCTIPGSATVTGVTGTNIMYTLEKQTTVGGPFVPVGPADPSNLFGNILDDDADPALPNYRISISTANSICANTSTLIVAVPNSCLGNPVCPTYDVIGLGAPQFVPVTSSTVCAGSAVNFAVSINGVCTNGLVEVMYDSNPSFDPYTQGTSLGTFGTTVGATPSSTTSTNKVFINEFAFRPAQGTCSGTPDGLNPNSGEWLELYNAGATSADISGWSISDGDWTATVPGGTIIASGAFYLIGGGGTFCSTGVEPDLNIETCNCATVSPVTADIMNLTNSGEQLALYDCSGNYIDGVLWGASGQGLPDVTSNNAPAAGCGNYITAKSLNLPAAASFSASGSSTGAPQSGRYRTATNTWVATTTTTVTPITPKASNPGGNYTGSAVPFGTVCPAPPVTSNFTFTLPDTCSLTSATNITVKVIYKPTPLSPCTESAVTATANYTIPQCTQFTLTGNGEYCEPNNAPISIASSQPLVGLYDITLSNGTTNETLTGVSGNGPFTANLTTTGTWEIVNVTTPLGQCSPKKVGEANISIFPIPTITASPTSVNACYLNNFDLSTINSQITSTPFANNYAWYTQPTGGSPLASTLISPLSTGNYYVSPFNGTSAFCEGSRVPVLINVNPLPLDPTIVLCNNLTLELAPQNPNCQPITCGNVEYSANGIDWSTSLTYTAADPGWNNWGSATNSGMFLRDPSSPACISYYYYINPCSYPLPASLLSFTASLNEKQLVDINWRTSQEKNVDLYEVERSTSNQLNFNKLGEIKASQNGAMENNYYLLDKNPSVGYNYYRIKIQDQDGQTKYSAVEKVFINTLKSEITSLYPNPANDNISVEISSLIAEKVKIQVFDMVGKIVIEEQVQLGQGANSYILPIKALATGAYMIRIPFAKGVDVKSFIKE